MLIYHTCASPADVETAREHAPSYEYGFGWIPEKICRYPGCYFVDNGCFGAREPGDHWQEIRNRDSKVATLSKERRFVVLAGQRGIVFHSLVDHRQ